MSTFVHFTLENEMISIYSFKIFSSFTALLLRNDVNYCF